MQEAMKMIRDEIGPDAVILDSNPVRSKGLGGLFKQGVEVVAAYEPAAGRQAPTPAPKVTPAPKAAPAPQPVPVARPAERPLHVVQSVAARYAAVARPEPAHVVETAEPELRLEPVVFPALDLAGQAQSAPAAKPEPARVAEMPKPEPMRVSEVPKPEPMRVSEVRQPEPVRGATPLFRGAEEAPRVRPAMVEYQAEAEPLRDEIASLKDTMQAFTQRVGLMTRDPALTLPPDILGLYGGLIDRDVPEELARQLAVQAQAAKERRPVRAETAARQIIMDRLGEPTPIRIKAYRQNVLFFVGPTGAGKTTTLVKLAGMLALEHQLRVGLINMDTYRIGAMEHLRVYADIMNIPLHTAYSADDLSEALAMMADRDVVLVDTAGKATGDEDYRRELSDWIKAARADEVFLVLSVATGHRASREIVRNYSFLPDYKLIVTKLDEVNAWGNVLHLKELAGKPLSYVTVGQNVPDDIRPVDAKRIADNIVGKRVSAI
jgi:flagellar biosynthesis protein FlhF